MIYFLITFLTSSTFFIRYISIIFISTTFTCIILSLLLPFYVCLIFYHLIKFYHSNHLYYFSYYLQFDHSNHLISLLCITSFLTYLYLLHPQKSYHSSLLFSYYIYKNHSTSYSLLPNNHCIHSIILLYLYQFLDDDHCIHY